MLTIDIPGSTPLNLRHLVLHYNGTLAEDGELLSGVEGRLRALNGHLQIHIITADTHGTVGKKLAGLQADISIRILEPKQQDEQKYLFIRELGAISVVAMGNGRNDVKMLEAAGLGVGILQREGLRATLRN